MHLAHKVLFKYYILSSSFLAHCLFSLPQNCPTKAEARRSSAKIAQRKPVVWIFGVQSTVPLLTSSLNGTIKNMVCIMKSGDFKKDWAQPKALSQSNLSRHPHTGHCWGLELGIRIQQVVSPLILCNHHSLKYLSIMWLSKRFLYFPLKNRNVLHSLRVIKLPVGVEGIAFRMLRHAFLWTLSSSLICPFIVVPLSHMMLPYDMIGLMRAV